MKFVLIFALVAMTYAQSCMSCQKYVNDNKKLAECEKALEQFSSTQCPLLLEKVQSGTLDNVPLEMKVHCGTNQYCVNGYTCCGDHNGLNANHHYQCCAGGTHCSFDRCCPHGYVAFGTKGYCMPSGGKPCPSGTAYCPSGYAYCQHNKCYR